MAKIIKDQEQAKALKAKAKLEKRELRKQQKLDRKNKNQKKDVPVLKNPAQTIFGRIIIWILLLAMGLGGLASVIYLIVKLALGR